MLKPQSNKKGFTIIEVVLVLAIAGLIFMAVFIALPALQRSQRDTRRKQDISRVIAQLQGYQGSNKSRLPAEDNGQVADKTIDGEAMKGQKANLGTWEYFYNHYLVSEENDDFSDPSGGAYSLKIRNDDKGLADTFKEQSSDSPKNAIVINVNHQCDGESVKKATGGSRKVAVRYRAEGGSIICQNN